MKTTSTPGSTAKTIILFRSDTRHPLDDKIFENGMLPREPSGIKMLKSGTKIPSGIIYRGDYICRDLKANCDAVPQTAVCATKRLAVAPYFPYKHNKRRRSFSQNTWIYVVMVSLQENDSIFHSAIKCDTPHINIAKDKISNIHGRQTCDVLNSFGNGFGTIFGLFAEEIALSKITPNEIVAAIPCSTNIKYRKPHQCNYTLYSSSNAVLWQYNTFLSDDVYNRLSEIKQFVENERGRHKLPLPSSGYHSVASQYHEDLSLPFNKMRFQFKRIIGIVRGRYPQRIDDKKLTLLEKELDICTVSKEIARLLYTFRGILEEDIKKDPQIQSAFNSLFVLLSAKNRINNSDLPRTALFKIDPLFRYTRYNWFSGFNPLPQLSLATIDEDQVYRPS